VTVALDGLGDDPAALRGIIRELALLLRHRFGRRSEKLDPEQLAFEFAELREKLNVLAELHPGEEPPGEEPPAKEKPEKKGHGRSRLTGNVRRIKGPEGIIEKGRPCEGLLSEVVTGKFADQIPLTRLSKILARHGVKIATSTLGDWIERCADLLEPLVIFMTHEVLASQRLHTDDTPVPVLDREKWPISSFGPRARQVSERQHVAISLGGWPSHSISVSQSRVQTRLCQRGPPA
jgi:hypothetical protein